ncbi:MAG TPA: dihydroorotate dehydrogenase electron transfer subunit [Candidatus Hydrogenedentes bacterium]|nr:dihydroorotate dehydrogenase electron transfer subunit [Candidatus Hydrogenedentota bacterium]
MAVILDCEITAHKEVAPDHRRMVARAPEIAAAARPGQFCMIEVREGFCPFLRRPMSIERIFRDGISFLYKIVGHGTRLLAGAPTGMVINVQGPLGNGFPIAQNAPRCILVAGGVGVAPMPGLAEAIMLQTGRVPEVILAARTERFLLCENEFSQMGCPVTLATDDGSVGYKGYAADCLRLLAPDDNTIVYACGPTVMMRTVHEVCAEADACCYASLEAEMACGDGVCMGCVVETNTNNEFGKMARVCREGPVFDTRMICWSAYDDR